MKNKLDEIMMWKREEVKRLEAHADELKKLALKRNDFRGFRQALQQVDLGLIAEVKKASPSAGVIQAEVDPAQQAFDYQFGGAHAISVLTDEKYFHGHLMDLKAVRAKVSLPLLRKDFMVHRNQIYEAIVAGADAILLIVAGLGVDELSDLYQEARDLQLDVLVEVHDLREMDCALDLGADLIGINNRNLQTFDVSLTTTLELAEEAPSDVVLVSESGIRSREDVTFVKAAGVDAILVGETLMRATDVRVVIRDLLGEL
ncbi:MAG: indole-3-glycerol phosphate synthase TrpC [Verrucomicrobiae bacterium]|nr:indole-3-glycerol phosphate synthase TrpC [Verrucomicrobiae bacterium]